MCGTQSFGNMQSAKGEVLIRNFQLTLSSCGLSEMNFPIDGFPLPMGKLTSLQGLQEPENPPSFQLLTTACVPINARFQLMLFAIPVSGLVFCSI